MHDDAPPREIDIATAKGDICINEDELPTITDAELARFRLTREELNQLFAMGVELAPVQGGSMRVQFGRLRRDLVISDGSEAWILTRAGWEQIDATTAFLKSDWLTPAQARRAFGDQLPALPPRAFAGRDARG
jgi:hypothetical protein